MGDGVTQIRLPMRDNPLRYVNAYAVASSAGLVLIDCGWRGDDVLDALRGGLRHIGADVSDITRLFVTHFHPDHYGLAATLRRAGVPELIMHAADWLLVERIARDPAAAEEDSDAWLRRHGMPPADTAAAGAEANLRRWERAEPTLLVDDGAILERLAVVWTPGHAPGHLCFIDRVTGALFSGDHVLDPVTPHVGLWFEDRGDPLADYLASLARVREMRITRVLPAHGEPFDDLARRVDALFAHHAEREGSVLEALGAGPRTAYDTAAALPWTRGRTAFTGLAVAQREFAVAETIAHLEHLRRRGVLRRGDEPAVIRYALASS